jgi:site-specific DNA recombinase
MVSLAPAVAHSAAIYRRVSRQQQVDAFSLAAQTKDCRKLAGEIGAEVVASFEDVDSGADWDLPGLDAMLDAAKAGSFDTLVVYDPDRLARNMAKQLVIEEELGRYGVTIKYVTLPTSGSPEDNLLKNVRSSIAEYEREKIRIRTQRGIREKIERGLIVGKGFPPFGYQFTRDATGRVVGLELNPKTAPIVARIVVRLQTRSLPTVCMELNAESIPSSTGGRWRRGTVRDMMRNPTYVGRYYHGRTKQPKVDGSKRKLWQDVSGDPYIPVPAIVSEADFEAARAAMHERKSRHGRRRANTSEDPYSLRGLLTCAHCGGPLSCKPNNGIRYYACLRHYPQRLDLTSEVDVCKGRPVPSSALEQLTWETVTGALFDRDRLRTALADARLASAAARRQADRLALLDAEIAKREKRLVKLTIDRLDAEAGSPAEAALRAAADQTEQEIRTLRSDADDLRSRPTPGIGDAEADAIEAFAAEVREGAEHVTEGERRRIYELLRLRAVVGMDPVLGYKLSRASRHSVRWEAIIPLRNGDRISNEMRLESDTDASGNARPEQIS